MINLDNRHTCNQIGSHLVDNDEKDEMAHSCFRYSQQIFSVLSHTPFSAQLDLPNFCKFQLHEAILENLRVFESAYVIAGFLS